MRKEKNEDKMSSSETSDASSYESDFEEELDEAQVYVKVDKHGRAKDVDKEYYISEFYYTSPLGKTVEKRKVYRGVPKKASRVRGTFLTKDLTEDVVVRNRRYAPKLRFVGKAATEGPVVRTDWVNEQEAKNMDQELYAQLTEEYVQPVQYVEFDRDGTATESFSGTEQQAKRKDNPRALMNMPVGDVWSGQPRKGDWTFFTLKGEGFVRAP